MDRVKVNDGSSISLGTTFDRVQDYFVTNLGKRFLRLFKSFGVVKDTISSGLQIELNVDSNNLNRFVIHPGSALLVNQEQITIVADVTSNLTNIMSADNLVADAYYLLKLRYAAMGVEPIAVTNAFMYTGDVSSPFSSKYSKFLDSYIITGVRVYPGDAHLLDNVGVNEVGLAIIKTDAANALALNYGAWTFDDLTVTNGVADFRPLNTIKLSKNLLDEQEILFKDRDSIGNKKINGAIETSSYFKMPQLNLQSLTQVFKLIGADTGLTIAPDTTNAPIKILNKDGGIVAYFDPANGRLGLNKQPTQAALDVLGNIETSGDITSDANMVINVGSDHTGTFKYVASDTEFDIYANDNSSGGGSLNLKPVGNNRPINVYDKDGNLIFNINTATKKIGINTATTADTVTVLGTVSVLGTIKAQDGQGNSRYVMLQPLDILASGIKNFIITDVAGTNVLNQLRVNVQWGFADIVGTGGNNNFTITSTTMNVIANELAGYYLYIPSTLTNYKITANTATAAGNVVLTLTKIDDTSINLTGTNTTSPNYGLIHSNADEYDIKAVPNDGSGNYIEANAITSVVVTDSYVAPHNTNLLLTAGVTYKIKILAKKGNNILTWQEMLAGSYSKYSVTQSYGDPFVCTHPMLPNTGMSVVAARTEVGADFTLSGSAWDYAEGYGWDVVYAPVTTGDVTARTINCPVQAQKVVHVSSPTSLFNTSLYVKVYAYISGQVVGVLTRNSGLPAGQDYDVTSLTGPQLMLSSTVQNFRITDILGIKSLTDVNVQLKWGYCGLYGAVVSGVFTATCNNAYDTLTATLNSLAGQFVYLPDAQKNYRIRSNTVTSSGTTVITLENIDGTTCTDTYTVVTGNAAWIHQNAKIYAITAIPVSGGVEDAAHSRDITITAGTPVMNSCLLRLPAHISNTWNIKIKAIRDASETTIQTLQAGTFRKYGNTITYVSPTVVVPTTVSVDSSLTVNGGDGYLSISASNWADVEQIEYVCSTNSSVDFNSSFTSTVVTGKSATISGLTNNQTYYVKVRPLIASIVVAVTPLTGSATTAPNIYFGETTDNLKISGISGCGDSTHVIVNFSWGVSGVSLTAAGASWRVTAGAPSGNHASYWIKFADGNNYIIENDVTDGSGNRYFWLIRADGSFVTPSGSVSDCIVHQGANSGCIIAIPYTDGTNKDWSRMTTSYISDPYTVQNMATSGSIRVQAGIKYHFALQINTPSNSYAYVGDGGYYTTYTGTGVTPYQVSYTLPMIVQAPQVYSNSSYGDATVTGTGNNNGFTLVFDGSNWKNNAEQIQYVYALNATPVFDTGTGGVVNMLSNSVTVDIPLTTSGTYTVLARPLIGGKSITNPITTTVAAGAGGTVSPGDIIYAGTLICQTAHGSVRSVTANGTGAYIIQVSDGSINDQMLVPASSGSQHAIGANTNDSLVGNILTMSGDSYVSEYLITASAVSGNLYITRTSGTNVPTNGQTFKMNTSISGRMLLSTALAKDYRLKQLSVNILNWDGPAGIIRAYQQNHTADCDQTTPISSTNIGAPIPFVFNTTITSARGLGRNLVIDSFNPSTSTANDGTFIIQVMLTATPI